ncbi:kell blood group glycoprotein isoform X2 [Hoplias malabaricus]|uniref:kell blood group glycoprotein isoform X2 n=1 Tax=Hoplias malabaricus TaxID=27720 RepID=UPI0034623C7E
MDQNSSVVEVTFQLSQEQPETEQPKSLVKRLWLKFLLVLFVSALIGTLICLGFYSQRKTSEAPVPCTSPACLKVAEHLSAIMDPFSRPCDYFLFTCGAESVSLSRGRQRGRVISNNLTAGLDRRWTDRGKAGGGRRVNKEAENESHRDKTADRLPDRRTALLHTIKEILESPVRNVSMKSVKEKAQRFYNTCRDFKNKESLNSENFLALIQKLGGWVVSRRSTPTDFNETLTLLMSKYNTFPFFSVYVGPDRRELHGNGSQNYIQIDQPDFPTPTDWNSNTNRSIINPQSLRPFYSFCKQLLDLFNVPFSQHCGLYMSLCSTLVTATSPLTYRLSQKLLYHRITIQKLQLLAPAIDWLKSLQAIFHPYSVSQSDFVLLHNLPYIVHLSHTISDWKIKHETMGSDSLHMYMILTLLQTLIPAMDSRFTQTLRNFSTAIGSREEDVPHWRHCVQQTAECFETFLGQVIKEQYAREEAEEMMHDIYTVLKSKVVNLSWREEKTRDLVLNKINSLNARLSVNTEDQLDLNEHYAEVIINEKDYFSNYLQLLVLQQKRMCDLFSGTAQHDVLLISPFLSGNDVIIPVGLFVSPLFHPTYPRAVRYGMLGSIIAKDLLHLLLPNILSQSESPRLESECVWLQYLHRREGPGRSESSSLSQSQQKEVWVQYSALEIALQAYNKAFQRQSTDTSVSGLFHIHLFLTSFIQASCDSGPNRAFMPFEPSFLVTVLCRNSNFCPKLMTCDNKSQGNPQLC